MAITPVVPTYNPDLEASSRRSAKLEISFNLSAPEFVRVPSADEIGGWTPQTNVNRLPLFEEADGAQNTVVAVVENGGTLQFSTAAPSSNATVTKMFASRNKTVLYRYTGADGLQVTGQSKLMYRGEQGAVQDVPRYGWALETVTATITPAPTV